MNRFLQSSFPFRGCKGASFQLAWAWILGLIAGAIISVSAHKGPPLAYASSLSLGSSISVLSVIIMLPLICSVLAVYIRRPKLLLAIAFVKAFLFAYVASGILLSCAGAAWMVCLLMMFSDTLMLPLLWWFWLKAPDSPLILCCTAAASIPALAVIFIDSYIILPVLANLT